MTIVQRYDDPSQAKNERAAIKDILSFIGYKKYLSINRIVRSGGHKKSQFVVHCAFLSGIEGYPVDVWYDRIVNRPRGW